MEFLKGLVESFYSPHFYSDLGHKKQGIGALYILAVSVLMLLMVSLALTQTDFFNRFSRLADRIRTLPTVTIQGGHLSIDKPVPYVFSFAPDMNVEIDTAYKSTDQKELIDKMQHDKAFALITADDMVTYNGTSVQTQAFSGWKDQTITPEAWHKLAQWFEGSLGITLMSITAVFMLGSLFIVNFIMTLFVALAVAFAGMFARAGLGFEDAFRVAAALRIPVNVLAFLPFIGGVVSWLIWLAYVIFAVVSCRVIPKQQAV